MIIYDGMLVLLVCMIDVVVIWDLRVHYATFLLVINSNFGRISYSFRDSNTFSYKIACFPYPTIVWRRLAE